MEETVDIIEAMKMVGVPPYSESQWQECADKFSDVLGISDDPVVRLMLAAILVSSVPKRFVWNGKEDR